MSKREREEMCGAVRPYPHARPCDAPAHPPTEPHDPDGEPWYEVPLAGGGRRG